MESYVDVKVLGSLLVFAAIIWLVMYFSKPKAVTTAGGATTTTTP